jgi:hypothetical protein
MLTPQHEYACLLTCLPQDITEEELKAVLAEALQGLVRAKNYVVAKITHNARSASAVVTVKSKAISSIVRAKVAQLKIRGRAVAAGRMKLDSASREANAAKPPAATTPGTKQSKRKQAKQQARDFYQLVLKDPEMMKQAQKSRSATARLVRLSYKISNAHPVLVALRDLKLLVVRNGRVVFANAHGQFPPDESEQDKHGIRVECAPEVFVRVGAHGTMNIQLANTSNKIVSMLALEMMPAHVVTHSLLFPMIVSAQTTLAVAFQPKQIGVIGATLRFCFYDGTKQFEISRHVKLKVGSSPEMDAILKPTAPYERRKRTKAVRHDAVCAAPRLPNSNKTSNPFASVLHNMIPKSVRTLLDTQEIEMLLQKYQDWKNYEACSIAGYASYWKHVLWASEYQDYLDIQQYDLENVLLKQQGNRYSLVVAGLEEGRPSIVRGDVVNVTLNQAKTTLYQGRVDQVRLHEVWLLFSSAFKYNGVDRVHARFTFSRMPYRLTHEAVVRAEERMKKLMLIPDVQDVVRLRENSLVRSVPQGWIWANRNLNQEQSNAVMQIVQGGLRPLPYIIFGPPGTGMYSD